jgi:hypothetical protein
MVIMVLQATSDLLDRQRVQKQLTRLRKRLITIVIKANPESFDLRGRLAPGCFPARIPSKAADLHGQMRRAECKLAMIRSHAECRHRELVTEQNSSFENCDTGPSCFSPERHDCSAGTGNAAVVIL